jgi:NAD(P)-dependent dehydrogenase (short-subunit alcohol dehydrogenase family)
MSSSQKVVVVTGAAGGLGSAAVSLLAQRGASVLCVDRNAGALTDVVNTIAEESGADLVAASGDIGEAADAQQLIEQAVSHWGGLDGVFNIAGVEGQLAPIVDTPVAEFDDVMHVNVRGTWLSMKFALPHLEARGGGVIVNVGSYQATHGKANCSAYSGSKHAIVGMTRSVALEYASRNVRANVVCPGAMDTRMIRTMMRSLHPEDPSRGERQLLADIPQGRMGRPSEVASVGVWMILDAPEHLTGQVLTVDGGKSAA